MRSSVQTAFIFLLASTASVLAIPASNFKDLEARASSVPMAAASAGTPCSSGVAALANGIMSNIADQRNEQNAVSAVGDVLAEQPMDSTMFDSAKTSLMNFVVSGINIRINNQKIAPAGNAAIPGLAVVAMAQMEELNLTMSLSATDLAGSNATVTTLKKDFAGGIVKNMENLQMALGGCSLAATPGASITNRNQAMTAPVTQRVRRRL